MKLPLRTSIFSLSVLLSCALMAQSYVGAFENNADGQLYGIKSSASPGNLELVRIEVFKGVAEAPEVSTAIGTVYSQQYRRVFAIYAKEDGSIVAHTAELVENQPVTVKHAFGAAFDPNYQAYFGVVLTEENKLLAIRATY